MNNELHRYLVASTDDNYDVIGIYHTITENEYEKILKSKHHPHSAFTSFKDAENEA